MRVSQTKAKTLYTINIIHKKILYNIQYSYLLIWLDNMFDLFFYHGTNFIKNDQQIN